MSRSNDEIDGDEQRSGSEAIARAADLLIAGKLVATPTETVYGLAADAANAPAVAEIYRTKGRPDFNPLIVHVLDLTVAKYLGQFNVHAEKLADAFWPGPLTLVVPKAPGCPVVPAVTAGLETIALRSPAHPVMRRLLKETGLFLAAPSANKSGGISPTTARHVETSLGEKIPFILDGGPSQNGLESTIVEIDSEQCKILRPGSITADMLKKIINIPVDVLAAGDKITAPGQLSSHYAPTKQVRLNVVKPRDEEYHIGFGNIEGNANLSPAADLAEAASNLFRFLHLADASDMAAIAVAPIPSIGIGLAINDRLQRAAMRR
ncbi:Threonylcarbamoyl-AMP synthase / SUA5 domain with internal deletion [hydrothermal vent metagenome]|uniref:Threonylcarbamoyl-AMP synthase n=1 Tax=hydrothermal vent metagenome TaxID=652676 RepID=A0A3B0RIH1_9ZZZZ